MQDDLAQASAAVNTVTNVAMLKISDQPLNCFTGTAGASPALNSDCHFAKVGRFNRGLSEGVARAGGTPAVPVASRVFQFQNVASLKQKETSTVAGLLLVKLSRLISTRVISLCRVCVPDVAGARRSQV